MSDQGGSCIAVDAMGSDKGPAEIVAAVKLALDTLPDLHAIILVGKEEILASLVSDARLADHPKLSIHHASEVITMDDKPLMAMKRKKDASMLRAIELVKEGKASVVISCGNTGSLMASGTLKLRTMSGVERPALASVMPNRTSHWVLVDAGANPQAKAEHIVHNAVLGSDYAKHVLGVNNPRVGLMNIGTEEGKGNDLTNKSHELLKRIPHVINYKGPVEGFQLFDDVVDVVVCDGFTGNVVLKSCESVFTLLKDFYADEVKKSPLRMLGYGLSKGAWDAIKDQLKPERYGGAPLLGLKGNVLKAHGSSNAEAVMNAIRIANEIVSKDLTSVSIADIEKANNVLYAGTP
ncbi:MAG: phosphate acyltransferase PlsX [Verrucomicrobiota bacterium]